MPTRCHRVSLVVGLLAAAVTVRCGLAQLTLPGVSRKPPSSSSSSSSSSTLFSPSSLSSLSPVGSVDRQQLKDQVGGVDVKTSEKFCLNVEKVVICRCKTSPESRHIIIIVIKGIYIAQVRKGHKCAMSAEMAVWLRNCLYLYSYLSHN